MAGRIKSPELIIAPLAMQKTSSNVSSFLSFFVYSAMPIEVYLIIRGFSRIEAGDGKLLFFSEYSNCPESKSYQYIIQT